MYRTTYSGISFFARHTQIYENFLRSVSVPFDIPEEFEVGLFAFWKFSNFRIKISKKVPAHLPFSKLRGFFLNEKHLSYNVWSPNERKLNIEEQFKFLRYRKLES